MSLYMGNLQPVFDELVGKLQGLDFPSRGNPFLMILDRLGRKYLVHSMHLEQCIRDNHLIFTAYYRNSELVSEDSSIYSVALPVDLYAGIEIHSQMPKDLENEYGSRNCVYRP